MRLTAWMRLGAPIQAIGAALGWIAPILWGRLLMLRLVPHLRGVHGLSWLLGGWLVLLRGA